MGTTVYKPVKLHLKTSLQCNFKWVLFTYTANEPAQWKGDTPIEDGEDNSNAVASQPTALPLEKMNTVPGYQNIEFDGPLLKPPTYEETIREPPQRVEIQWWVGP